MVERVETTEYALESGVCPDEEIKYFILTDKQNRNLTYFHSINGPWLMRDDLDDCKSHVFRRAGHIPEDVDGVVEEQLEFIKENGEMEKPSW